jgi:hypothetical protein
MRRASINISMENKEVLGEYRTTVRRGMSSQRPVRFETATQLDLSD